MPKITSDPFEALDENAQAVIMMPLQSPEYRAYILASALKSVDARFKFKQKTSSTVKK
jgi:hypothetical protein